MSGKRRKRRCPTCTSLSRVQSSMLLLIRKRGDCLKSPILGEFSKPRAQPHRLGAMQRLDMPASRFNENEEVDYLIVGVGAGGGVMLQRLARAGFRVLGLEAGPFWDYGARLGERRSGLSSALLGGPTNHRGRQSARFREQQLWQRRRRQHRTLGGIYPAPPSFRLPDPYRRWSRGRLAIQLRRTQAVLRVDGTGVASLRAGIFSLGRSSRLRIRSTSDGGHWQCINPRMHQARDPGERGRSCRHLAGFPRRSSTLYLSRVLHSGLQGRREGQHFNHARS